jgi:DNA-binding IscR family transcriptional regulator
VATEWSFLTNHGRALLCIAHDPGVRLREIAETLGITERSAYAIVNDLTTAGYVLKKRDGRRNRYVIQHHRRVPEPTLRERTVGDVVELLVGDKRRTRATAAKKTTRTARTSQNRARKSQKRR